MLIRKVSLACATICVGVAAPAAACDLHAPGQMAGFHRYNPFANAINNLSDRAFKKDEAAIARRDTGEKSEKAKKEEKRRQEALDAEAEEQKARDADLRERSQQGRSALK